MLILLPYFRGNASSFPPAAFVNFANAEFHSWLFTSLFTFQIKNYCNWSYRAIGRYRSDLYYLVVDCDYFVLYTKRLFVEIV